MSLNSLVHKDIAEQRLKSFWHVQSRRMRATMSLTAALLLTCLAACSTNGDHPTVLAPASPSSAVTSDDPSPSSEIDAPVLPPEAEVQTAAGAVAFVRHYFAVVDYAYATGDTARFAKVSDPEFAMSRTPGVPQALTEGSSMCRESFAAAVEHCSWWAMWKRRRGGVRWGSGRRT